jgi:hypothetical protein
MTDENPKKRSHSLRYILAIIGTLVLGWKVVAGFHDINLSYQGSLCVEQYLGPGFYEHWKQNRKWKKKNRWDLAAISYINTYTDPKKKNQALETLKQHCSEYIFVTKVFTPSIMNDEPALVEDGIIVNNWALRELFPAIYKERTKSMLFWAAFVFFCIVDIRRLKRIFIWSRDNG